MAPSGLVRPTWLSGATLELWNGLNLTPTTHPKSSRQFRSNVRADSAPIVPVFSGYLSTANSRSFAFMSVTKCRLRIRFARGYCTGSSTTTGFPQSWQRKISTALNSGNSFLNPQCGQTTRKTSPVRSTVALGVGGFAAISASNSGV